MTMDVRSSPTVDRDTEGYWASTARHRLSIQQCRSCGAYQHFPSAVCHVCWEFDLSFRELSGRGHVYTFVVIHHVTAPGYTDQAPYVVAWIATAEHPEVRVLGLVRTTAVNGVAIGDEVVVRFPESDDGFVVPEFDVVDFSDDATMYVEEAP